MTYRKDLNVLKGIAIISVVLFHLSEQLIASNKALISFSEFEFNLLGGFYGVDIFLVISGFLVSLYLQAKADKNSFTLKGFLSSRISKLAPQLIAVCVFTFLIGFFVFFLDSFESLVREIFKAVTFTSNFYYAKQQGYFAQDSMLQPLLHCWYLALTIQCYILISIVFLIFNKLRKTDKIWLAYLLLTIVSAILYFSAKDQSKAYYLPQYRGYEFFFGAFIGTLSSRCSITRFSKTLSAIASLAILATILCVSVVSAIGTIVVLIATALLLLCRSSVLNSNILEVIGKKSFSLYVWHWPLMVFVFLLYPDLFPVIIIIGCYILSEISSLLLKHTEFISKIKITVLVILVIAGACRAYLYYADHKVLDENDLKNEEIVSRIEPAQKKSDSFITINNTDKDVNTFKYMIEGDSNAGMFEIEFSKRFRNYISVFHAGTLIFGDRLRVTLEGIEDKNTDFSNLYLNDLNKGISMLDKGGKVFLIHRWYRYLKMYQEKYGKNKGRDVYLHNLYDDLRDLAQKYPDKTFYIFGQAPEPSEFLINCSKALEKLNPIANFIGCRSAKDNVSEDTALINNIFRKLENTQNNIKYIDRESILKVNEESDEYRLVDNNDHALFFDKGHLTAKGTEYVFKAVVK